MKYVNFEKVSIQNFLSVGDDVVSINFTPGLHIITGINKDKEDRRNGVGKSTIADAIHFAIFGNTIRELKKENIVNNINCKGCHVELDFDITERDVTTKYKIIRQLEPSRCKLYIDGVDSTRDSIANTTEYVCSIMAATPEVFQNCVILTVNNTTPFMAKKKIEKRKFIEGIFNLEVFSKMLTSLRSLYNDTKRDYEVEIARYEEAEKSKNSFVRQKQKSVDESRARIDKLSQRKTSNTQELSELKTEIFDTDQKELDSIHDILAKLDRGLNACDEKISEVNNEISTHTATITHNNDTLSKIGTDESTCPVCLRPVSDHDRGEIKKEETKIAQKIKELQSCISDCESNLLQFKDVKTKLTTAITNQNNLLKEHEIKIQQNNNNKKRITQLTEWNDQINDHLKELTKDCSQFDEQIVTAEKRLNTINTSIDTFKSHMNILDVVKFIVSEEGVKSYIVKKILQVFNHKLAYYLDMMDANCLCIFNEYFEEEIIDEKGKACSYFNFSGAERKNIDLACLFSFMDIRRLQGSVAYNLSIYDELLDSSLDERGVDLVLGILRQRVEKYNECIIIISHRKESVKIGADYKNDGGVIYLEKENGITRRVDFSEATV